MIRILFSHMDVLLKGIIYQNVHSFFSRYSLTLVINHACLHAKSLQLCLTLCDPMDCNPPGSSVHEILQARIGEWVAMPSSRASSRPGD